MKVGNDFNVPDKYKEHVIANIGGYKLIRTPDSNVMIQGNTLINLFDMEINDISILPLNKGVQLKLKDYPYDIEETIIYRVAFNNYAWYFKDKQDAFNLMNLIIQLIELSID